LLSSVSRCFSRLRHMHHQPTVQMAIITVSHKEMESRCSRPQDFPRDASDTWTCEDDVKYTCPIVNKAFENGEPVQQYYGKWPSWRLLGMQEPGSLVLRTQLLATWREGKSLRRRISREHPMRPYYIGFNIFSLNTWVWPAVFRTRGLSLTTMTTSSPTKGKPFKMDYFSTAATIIYSLFYTIVRLFHLYTVYSYRSTT